MVTPTGQVYLVANAVIDNTYQHTIDFKDASEQLAYWRSLSKYDLNDCQYIRKQREFILVPKSMQELDDVNYLVFQPETGGRWMFGFVEDKQYSDENATIIYFTLDVIQTYMFDIKFNPSYILQEHQDRWDANHKPIYSRTEESLEYGTEYTVESAYKVKHRDDDILKWFVFTCTEMATSGDEESISVTGDMPTRPKYPQAPTPFVYFLVPMITAPSKDSDVGIHFSYNNGQGVQTQNISDLEEVQRFMLESPFGQYVKNISLLPYCPFDFTLEKTTNTGYTYHISYQSSVSALDTGFDFTTLTSGSRSVQMMSISFIPNFNSGMINLASMDVLEGISSATPTAEQWEAIKSKPLTTERDKRFESKLLTHPYRYNMLTDWRNAPQIIKNEYLTEDKINLMMSTVFSFNCPSRYYIKNYKKELEGRGHSLVQSIQPEQPIISDAYYTYMLENKNQIQANVYNSISSASATIGNSMVNGAVSDGIGGAVLGTFTSIVSSYTSHRNMIRSENAKQRDIKNYPDTLISANDCSMALVDKNTYVEFYRYKICCEFEEQLAQYWHMYGYMCKRVKVPNLKSRTRFNYVKTVGANITGKVNQRELKAIREIFDNGITFWHYKSSDFKPLDYTYENIEVLLV